MPRMSVGSDSTMPVQQQRVHGAREGLGSVDSHGSLSLFPLFSLSFSLSGYPGALILVIFAG